MKSLIKNILVSLLIGIPAGIVGSLLIWLVPNLFVGATIIFIVGVILSMILGGKNGN